MNNAFLRFLLAAVLALCVLRARADEPPLRVILIPADGGTADGTIADYQPLFSAVGRMTGLKFELRVGDSYNAVVEAMRQRLADVAFFGPLSYLQAREKGAAELLAVAVENGASVYYAGIFVGSDSPIERLQDLHGRSVAFGDVNSASSFAYPLIMLMDAGIDPVKDLSAVRLTGSHASSLKALAEGQVDAACASFDSFEKAVRQKSIDPQKLRILAKSAPIPYPPLAMHPSLAPELKARLRAAFAEVHRTPGVTPSMIRGYGGKKVERYSTDMTEEEFGRAAARLSLITDQLRGELLRKSAER